MRQMFLVVDSECATYVGPEREYHGYNGKVAHKTSKGVWFTFKDTFLNGERVDTAWAYEMNETILTAFLGCPYYAPFVSLFVPHDRIHYRKW